MNYKSAKVSPKIKGEKLQAIFHCADGEQKCDVANLAMSDFFKVKLKGFDRMENKYNFGKGHPTMKHSRNEIQNLNDPR